MLPDDALLAIFDFCVDKDEPTEISTKRGIESWQTLVHVCRRWRSVVFGSPHRLNLQVVCTNRSLARKTLDIRPAFPIVIRCDEVYSTEILDNIIVILEHPNRVRQITIHLASSSPLGTVLEAMQVPFPELTYLRLWSDQNTGPVVPDSFLGGSASRLRSFNLYRISFPGLPNLLLSATHLVTLRLCGIPHSGYFPPEALVTALSTLTSLEEFRLQFESPLSCPDRASRRQPPPTRFVLPVLTYLWFKGVGEYFEDLVSHIDAPQLNELFITFFNQILFNTPQLIEFISSTSKLKALKKAHVIFEVDTVRVTFLSPTSEIRVEIPCEEFDWQVSSMEQVCTSCLPPLSTLEGLYISEELRWKSDWQGNIDDALWLELLHPFTAVKNLYISQEFARRIVPALVGGRTTEVLPALQNIFVEELPTSGPIPEGIQQFITTRQAGQPISVSRWDGRGMYSFGLPPY